MYPSDRTDMAGNNIGAAGNILAESIMKSLETCKNLKTIDLSSNTVAGSGHQLAQSIRQWGDNPPLQ